MTVKQVDGLAADNFKHLMGPMRAKDAPPLIPTAENPYTGPMAPFSMSWHDQMRAEALSAPTGAALSDSERHRLVEASKSPTVETAAQRYGKKRAWEWNTRLLQENHQRQRAEFELAHFGAMMPPATVREESQGRQVTPLNQSGCKAVVEYREWAEEWRVRTQVDATSGNPPPEQTERESVMLSDRGARKIAESCEYMAVAKGGYKTFVTGTFSQEARERIDAGETTIQREVSRCMDALQKLYQRGFESHGERVEAHPGETLPYCWVVEIPKNEQGEDNPHVHMLLGWKVPYRHFQAWAERIEGIWKNGYFHLEKIHDSACAGAYMAKAAGYMTKAQGAADQGKVKGNRYGISSSARAPAWVVIGENQLHAMGQLISDIYDHLTVVHGEKYQRRKRLRTALEATPKDQKRRRLKIGEALQKVREQIKEIPIRCNRYQVILKGRAAYARFFTWAQTPDYTPPVDWLPEKPAGVAWQMGDRPTPAQSHYIRALKRKFQEHKHKRHAVTDDQLQAITEQEQERRSLWGTIADWLHWERAGEPSPIYA